MRFADVGRHRIADVLDAARLLCPIDQRHLESPERWLKGGAAMAEAAHWIVAAAGEGRSVRGGCWRTRSRPPSPAASIRWPTWGWAAGSSPSRTRWARAGGGGGDGDGVAAAAGRGRHGHPRPGPRTVRGRPAGEQAGGDRPARLRELLPDRGAGVGGRAGDGHPGGRPRLRCRVDGLPRPVHRHRQPLGAPAAVRAVPLRAAHLPARHRPGRGVRAPASGLRPDLRAVRARAGGGDGHAGDLPRTLRPARHRPRARHRPAGDR